MYAQIRLASYKFFFGEHAPQSGNTLASCCVCGLDIERTIADIDALNRRDAEQFTPVKDRAGGRFMLGPII